ncbi:MAG: DMT family transporter [Planctomycetota bacterium]|nr:DMT family transporter [Planctomycetota bacterium]
MSPGTWWMVAAASSFVLMAAAAKMMPALSSLEMVFGRSVLSVAITAWMMKRVKAPAGTFKAKRPMLLFLRAVFGMAGLVCYLEAIGRIPFGTAVTIYNLTPVFAAIVGLLFLGEKISKRQAISILIGIGGVALIKGFSSEVTWPGVTFALGTAFFSAVAYTLVRALKATEHSLTIVMAFPLVSIPLTIMFGGWNFRMPEGMEWFWLVALGLATQSGQVCLTHALGYHSASWATQIGFIGVVIAMLLGIVLGDGLPGAAQIGGAALIFWSLLLGQKATSKSASPAKG